MIMRFFFKNQRWVSKVGIQLGRQQNRKNAERRHIGAGPCGNATVKCYAMPFVLD